MSPDGETINSGPMLDPDIRAIADWLIDGARSAPLPQQVLAQLCDRLVACGIPLWRVAVFVNTLHPQIIGRRFIWRPGADVEISEGRFGLFDTPGSPGFMQQRKRSGVGSPTRTAQWTSRSSRNFAPRV
jgi:hypothetical protein